MWGEIVDERGCTMRGILRLEGRERMKGGLLHRGQVHGGSSRQWLIDDRFCCCSRTLTGKEIEIDIEPTDKVERIKERVEEKEGIPPQQQRLIYSGKQMNDEKTAADYKIQGGSVLHLVLALRGGC
ncbi:hypothetical protein XELAEV_18010209mg [Xenopus laevis]|uniref:Ubiquitin-like protein NEDD8 n=1 Tax=Xenopus laevis TaxID=8355 RepID=A0A974I1Q3_XENLA|nr:hypothetical protein XELAEV_18010209mg [Xenopus laevis]